MKVEEIQMSIPTDRGFVALTRHGGITRSIDVCLRIIDGKPHDIFATHAGPGAVVIHSGVELVATEYGAFTQDLVEVYVDPAGGVHVAKPTGVHS
jgi:hypothetical protein